MKIARPPRKHRTRSCGIVSLVGACLALACGQPGPDAEDLQRTGIVWLEPLGSSRANGHATLVEKPDGIHLSLRLADLEPGSYRLLRLASEHCNTKRDGRELASRSARAMIRIESDGRVRLETRIRHASLAGDEPLLGRALALVGPARRDASERAVACGVVEASGAYRSESPGRWQGPPV